VVVNGALVGAAVMLLSWFRKSSTPRNTRRYRARHAPSDVIEDISSILSDVFSPPLKRVDSPQFICYEITHYNAILPRTLFPQTLGGLSDLAKFYRPNLPFLAKHKEWIPGQEGHSCLFSGAVQRATCIGSLYEKHRSLQRIYSQVMNQNMALMEEVQQFRALLDSSSLQEDILKETAERERTMRRVAEKERQRAVDRLQELEEELDVRNEEVAQLQHLLRNALDSAEPFEEVQEYPESPQQSQYAQYADYYRITA